MIPGLVQGPTLVLSEFSSGQYMKAFMMGAFPAYPKVSFPVVDVRNVAQAHLQAVKVPEARNQRFLLIEGNYRFLKLSETLRSHFGDVYPFTKVESTECPADNLRFQTLWDIEPQFDNSKSKKVLGIKYLSLEDTLVTMANQLINEGLIPDKRAAKKCQCLLF